jgi:hypothetical protein
MGDKDAADGVQPANEGIYATLKPAAPTSVSEDMTAVGIPIAPVSEPVREQHENPTQTQNNNNNNNNNNDAAGEDAAKRSVSPPTYATLNETAPAAAIAQTASVPASYITHALPESTDLLYGITAPSAPAATPADIESCYLVAPTRKARPLSGVGLPVPAHELYGNSAQPQQSQQSQQQPQRVLM